MHSCLRMPLCWGSKTMEVNYNWNKRFSTSFLSLVIIHFYDVTIKQSLSVKLLVFHFKIVKVSYCVGFLYDFFFADLKFFISLEIFKKNLLYYWPLKVIQKNFYSKVPREHSKGKDLLGKSRRVLSSWSFLLRFSCHDNKKPKTFSFSFYGANKFGTSRVTIETI